MTCLNRVPGFTVPILNPVRGLINCSVSSPEHPQIPPSWNHIHSPGPPWRQNMASPPPLRLGAPGKCSRAKKLCPVGLKLTRIQPPPQPSLQPPRGSARASPLQKTCSARLEAIYRLLEPEITSLTFSPKHNAAFNCQVRLKHVSSCAPSRPPPLQLNLTHRTPPSSLDMPRPLSALGRQDLSAPSTSWSVSRCAPPGSAPSSRLLASRDD